MQGAIESSLPLELIAASVSAGLAILRDGVLVAATSRYLGMHGYTREELMGQEIFPLTLAAGSREEVERQAAPASDSWKTATGLRQDGSTFPVEIKILNQEFNKENYQIVYIKSGDDKKLSEISREERLRPKNRASELAEIGYWERDPNKDAVFWSKEIYRIFGVEPESSELSWNIFLQLIHPGDLEYFQKNINYILDKKEKADFSYRIITPGGQKRTIRTIGDVQLDRDGGVSRIRGTVHDITKERKIEERMLDSELKFQLLTKSIKEVFRISTRGGGRMIYISPAYEKLWQMSSESLYSSPQSFLDAVHPEDLVKLEDVITNYHRKGLSYDLEYRIVGKNKEIRWIHERGYPVPGHFRGEQIMTGLCTDITGSKMAEEKLRAQAEILAAIFDASPNILAILNHEGRVEKINKKAVDFTGRKKDELIDLLGGEVFNCVNSFDGEGCSRQPECADCPIRTKVQDAFTTGRAHIEEEAELNILVNGKKKVVDFLISTNRIEIDGRIRVLLSVSNITKLKQIERQNSQLQSRLVQAQKLEAIGTLAGGIAHDFNNILSAILGFTELALGNVGKGSILEEDLLEVYAAGKRGRDLIKQILTFARRSDEELKPLRLETIAKEVFKFLRSSIPTSIKIEQEFNSSALILGNPTQIHQVFMNLCTNAAYAMEEKGGTLTVVLDDEIIETGSRDNGIGLKPGSYIRMTISDTGVGIAPKNIDLIFEPYFTTKEHGEGTGLGLAVIHGIIESYGGKITVQSEVGRGTTFRVYLPVTQELKAEKKYEAPPILLGVERVLLIDDEAAIAKVGRKMLESLGYSVTTRLSSVEALELFRIKSNHFDLVVTDMTMPNMTGDELAVELRKVREDIPIILSTGFSKKVSDERIRDLGFNALVYKPIVKAELANTIREVLDNG